MLVAGCLALCYDGLVAAVPIIVKVGVMPATIGPMLILGIGVGVAGLLLRKKYGLALAVLLGLLPLALGM